MKTIFLHIPKCAGTSIQMQVLKEKGENDCMINATSYDIFVTPINNLSQKDYFMGHFNYEALQLIGLNGEKNIFFTILRNPMRRIISLYYYYKNMQLPANNNYPPVIMAKNMDFISWYLNTQENIVKETENAIIQKFVPTQFFNHKEKLCPNNILKFACDFVNKFQLVGFNEDFVGTCDILSDILGFKVNPMTRENVGSYNYDSIPIDQFKEIYYDRNKLEILFIEHCIIRFNIMSSHKNLYFTEELRQKVFSI